MKNYRGGLSVRKSQINKFVLLFTAMVIIISSANSASFPQEESTFTLEKQKKLITAVCEKLEKFYTFPEIGLKTSQSIRRNFAEGKYSGCKTPSDFVRQLNKDFEKNSQDSHLEIAYDPETAARLNEQEATAEKESFAALRADEYRWSNFGFKECKILDGNIGYMDIRAFVPPKYAGATAVAAMNYFSNCRALIIDLRKNSGGWGTMVAFLASYFFDTEDPVLFSISQSTLNNTYYSSTTATYVPGKILSDIPLYILTSGLTASAAEGFANIMKNLNDRATLVGEKTAGAENPAERVVIGDEFILKLPCWRRIFSAVKEGWEGVGVKPDIEAKADNALYAAHLDALNKLLEKESDEKRRKKYRWAIDGVKAMEEPATVAKAILQSYAGEYGRKAVYYENGELLYEFKGMIEKRRMTPISENYFLIENSDDFRVRFIKEKDAIVGFEEIFDDGYIIENKKIMK